MATYTMLRNGSTGADVKKLQQTLKDAGYNIGSAGVDGIYGNQTASAVKAYQKANGLAVDGIAGDETLGNLYGSPNVVASSTMSLNNSQNADNDGFSYDPFQESDETREADEKRQELEDQKPGEFTYDPYEKSDAVKEAERLLQQQIEQKPGDYESPWQSYIDDTLNKILNRDKFTYDLNGDALYQQYKDQYMLQGQQAMMDTMGQAQAMTGGYGNSYAQTAGQQTYQGYLQQLNDKVPELYQLALDQYNQEGQDLYNQYGLFADRENQDYSRYRDTVADYYTELERLTENARYMSETEYNRFIDDLNMRYGMHRDDVADWQYDQNRADDDYWNLYNRDYRQYIDNKNFDYGQYIDKLEYDYRANRDAIADAETKRQYAYDTAMAMLNLGVMPSAQMLKDAGISSADAKAIIAKIKKNEAKLATQYSGGNSGGGGNGGSGGSGGNGGNGGNGGSGVTILDKDTPAMTSFIGKIRTRDEFHRGAANSNSEYAKYKTYENYVLAMLEKYEGDLTDDEIATIAHRYGVKLK